MPIPIPKAAKKDYENLQGEEPALSVDPETGMITTKYSNGTEIKSHIDHGTVNIGGKEFEVDKVRALHGDPCEKESRKVGGQGYPRKNEGE